MLYFISMFFSILLPMFLSYRNQSTDFQSSLIDWILYPQTSGSRILRSIEIKWNKRQMGWVKPLCIEIKWQYGLMLQQNIWAAVIGEKQSTWHEKFNDSTFLVSRHSFKGYFNYIMKILNCIISSLAYITVFQNSFLDLQLYFTLFHKNYWKHYLKAKLLLT